jgi:hypothetical protein
MEEHVPIIRVKQSRGSHTKTYCVDTEGVANQREWHYHKLCTAQVELAGKLRDRDDGSDVRSINKEWIIGCNGNNEVRSSERVTCDATREWKQPHMNCLIVINSVWLRNLTVIKEW